MSTEQIKYPLLPFLFCVYFVCFVVLLFTTVNGYVAYLLQR